MLGWELPPHNSGGLGVACYHLCKHLADQGVEIDFVVPGGAAANELIDFMSVYSAPPASAFLPQFNTGAYDSAWHKPDDPARLAYTNQVMDLIELKTYDAIHAHDWLTYEAGMKAKSVTGLPLIAHVHATEFDRAGGGQGNSLVREIEYQGLLMADTVVAVSQATKDLIVQEYDIPQEKIQVVHNSIEPSLFVQPKRLNRLSYLNFKKRQGYSIYISIGRLTIQKGLSYLLESFAKAVQKNPKLILVVAGSGEQYEELIALTADLQISKNVIFTGFVRGAEWRDVYNIGDAYIMPSVSEPFGLAALEAAGYQNLVLISRQSGVGEVLRNVMKFDFWDTNLLASQMIAIASYSGLRITMTTELKREFVQFSWVNAAEKMKQLYKTYTEKVVV